MIGRKIVAVAALSSLALGNPNIQNHGNGNSEKDTWKSKIKNVVVLVEENRSFDTFAGGLSYNKAINGLLHHNYCNSM
jgi:phospholipase C